MVRESDRNSELHKIMDRKRPSDHQLCELDTVLSNPEKLNSFDFTKAFFVMNKSVLYITLTFSTKLRSSKDGLIFENALFDQELLKVQYITKSLNDQVKQQLMKR